MQRRVFRRIRSRLKARFFFGNDACSGTVLNISERGMFIQTKICFPFEWEFDVLIYSSDKFLKVPVKLNRLIRSDKSPDVVAVEILNPPKEYLEFLQSLKPVSRSKNFSGSSISGQSMKGVRRNVH